MVKEIRRTCRNCGTTWHSLKSRETQIKLGIASDIFGGMAGASQQCSSCGMCGGTRTAQSNRNVDANQGELDRLKSCPQCGSHNYYEELLEY